MRFGDVGGYPDFCRLSLIESIGIIFAAPQHFFIKNLKILVFTLRIQPCCTAT
jgi:hypothetical protein